MDVPQVQLSAAAAQHPDAREIRTLLQHYFTSINTLDYQLWVDSVTAEQVEPFPANAWVEAYRTSKDFDIVIIKIDPQTRWTTVTFRSTQSADKSPDGKSECLEWTLVKPVVAINDRLRLAKTVHIDDTPYRACTS